MGKDTVDAAGKFVLKWTPKVRLGLLRVRLEQFKSFAGSAAAVPEARISSCKVTSRTSGWSIVCRTTARTGSVARLLRGGTVTDRARVRQGSLTLNGTGPVAGHTIDIASGAKGHVRLNL